MVEATNDDHQRSNRWTAKRSVPIWLVTDSGHHRRTSLASGKSSCRCQSSCWLMKDDWSDQSCCSPWYHCYSSPQIPESLNREPVCVCERELKINLKLLENYKERTKKKSVRVTKHETVFRGPPSRRTITLDPLAHSTRPNQLESATCKIPGISFSFGGILLCCWDCVTSSCLVFIIIITISFWDADALRQVAGNGTEHIS